jgi:hypothetical protein
MLFYFTDLLFIVVRISVQIIVRQLAFFSYLVSVIQVMLNLG